MEFTIALKQIATPANSQESPPAHFSSPRKLMLVTSSTSLDLQAFTDPAELNNRVATIARQFNMSIEELVRSGHLVVFEGEPIKLAEPPAMGEVLRVE